MRGGYRVLHDTIVFLKPLRDITIDEEPELYVTSSAVVPRLAHAKSRTEKLIDNATRGSTSGDAILDLVLVKSWKSLLDDLWNTYMEGFLHDEVFLCATLLDAGNGCGENFCWTLLKEALCALRLRTKKVYGEFEHKRQAQRIELSAQQNNGAQVASSRAAGITTNTLEKHAVLAAFGVTSRAPGDTEILGACRLFNRTYKTVEDELRARFDAVKQSKMKGK